MTTTMVSTELILQLIPLAIQAFGAISAEVLQLRQAAGLSDEQLLAHAEQTNQETLDLIQKHLQALGDTSGLPRPTADHTLATPLPPDAAVTKAGEAPAAAAPSAGDETQSGSATSAKMSPGGALVHGQ